MDCSAEYLLELLKNNAELRGIYSAVCKKDFKSYILLMFFLINSSKYKLKPFHIKVMKALQDLVEGKNTKRNLALCLPVGCLSGDTVIRYNRATLGKKITLKDMYERQNNISKRYKWDLSIPTKVRSYIEKEDRIRLNEVDCVTYSGKKMVYKLTLEDGKSLKATIEHKIMTNKGFVELGNLKKGDMVMVDNIVGKKKKEESEATYRKNRKEKTKCVGKYHPYSKTSDNYSWRVELHRAIYEAHLNNMSLEDFCYACKFPNKLKFVDPKIYHIHHIDHDHSNNDIENLQCLTKEEHLKLHGNYNHFGHGKPEYSAVKSIEEIGIEDTYDITCFDNPNFSANNIIVHNSGKSLLVEYFITWCFARSVDNAFCYVAYSDRLITKLSKESKDIIESEAFKLLFNHYLKKDDRQKINYSFQGAKNRTGLTAGTLNSALTGIDVANPNVEGFSGALIVDDAMSADEAVFPNARETVVRVYDEKLATRRRTAHAPTILIMQRLHVDDLVGWTKKNEPDQWEYVEVPALDENDKSFWEERYPAEELKRIREINPYKFQAQYQQNPIVAGGQMIKSEWFQFYQTHPKYTRIFITSDTAMKTGQHNDYSVFMVWGVYQHSIYLIDMVRGKWEAPELLRQIRDLTNRYWLWENRLKMSALYIEDKASGVGLIQQMKRESKVPVIPLTPTKDKVSRVEEALPFLQAGRVFLPFNREYGQNPVIIGECEMFARDLSHTHDDVCFVAGTKVATLFGDKNIEDVKVGDYVFTPFGIKKVLQSGQTGYTETIKNIGLEGTYNHKVFANGTFDKLGNLRYDVEVDRLSYGGLLKWKYKKLLSLMESNIDLWEREDIILANRLQIKEGKVLKDFMLRFGNIIADKKYQKAILFITKMVTILTTTSLTWSVYQGLNILKSIEKKIAEGVESLNKSNFYPEYESLQKNGMQAKRVELGTNSMPKKLWTRREKQKCVPTAEGHLKHAVTQLSAKDVTTQNTQENIEEESRKKVYNIKVKDVGVYYANGILVSNCDTLMYGIQVSSGLGRAVSIFET